VTPGRRWFGEEPSDFEDLQRGKRVFLVESSSSPSNSATLTGTTCVVSPSERAYPSGDGRLAEVG
jgi:hypothetical protein